MSRLCEDVQHIDVRRIDFQRGTQWQYPTPHGIAVAVSDNAVRIVYGSTECRVEIDYTNCNYGGWRRWFLCPGCGDRRAVLYDAGDGFGCRRCMRLIHTSTTEDKFDRLRRKGEKLAARLREYEANPKWKRCATYERIHWQRVKAERDAVFWLTRWLGR